LSQHYFNNYNLTVFERVVPHETYTLHARWLLLLCWYGTIRVFIQIGALFYYAHVTRYVTNAHLQRVRAALLAFIFGIELFVAIFGFTRVTCEIVLRVPSGYARPIILDVALRLQTILAQRVYTAGCGWFDGRVLQVENIQQNCKSDYCHGGVRQKHIVVGVIIPTYIWLCMWFAISFISETASRWIGMAVVTRNWFVQWVWVEICLSLCVCVYLLLDYSLI